jgi:hypothetical protein
MRIDWEFQIKCHMQDENQSITITIGRFTESHKGIRMV